MTHPTYTQQALCRHNLPHLKRIAAELGATATGDKKAWINAIISHQSAQLQKADEQTFAQTVALAPEELRIVEISFYDHEYYAGNKLIATITHDDNLTQPWVVLVGNTEKFRANTWAKCHRYISWHYRRGTLSKPAGGRSSGREQGENSPCMTENEIMAQIFNECEKS